MQEMPGTQLFLIDFVLAYVLFGLAYFVFCISNGIFRLKLWKGVIMLWPYLLWWHIQLVYQKSR